MKICSIKIKNFRAFKEQTILFNDYTCMVGPNGGGKSTILQALNVFFGGPTNAGDSTRLDRDDFHHQDVSNPIVITVTFDDLSTEAQEDLKAYYRQGKLIVSASASWNEEDGYAEIIQYGLRLGMAQFAPFFKADGDKASVKELRDIYAAIREKFSDLPSPGTKQSMIDALRAFEGLHTEKCVEIESEDQFYGISKGTNLIGRHIQWVFIPAMKDASEEEGESKKSALGTLLERTVRTKVNFAGPLEGIKKDAGDKYQAVLNDQQAALSSLSKSLSSRMAEWAHPGASVEIAWHYDESAAVRISDPLARATAAEGAFKGKLARFGHGIQRSFLLAMLEELAVGEEASPRLILGCEEPELFQHPPQARHLSNVFQRLAVTGSQVMICTHSPYFISGSGVEDVRSVRPGSDGKCCLSYSVTVDEIANTVARVRGEAPKKPGGTRIRMQQALQPVLSEIFFTRVVVLVEGLEDVAYITAQMLLMNLWDDFRRWGGHLVSADGKSEIVHPLAIASHLKIPAFVVFDSDNQATSPSPADTPEKAKQWLGNRRRHQLDNQAILSLCGSSSTPFPATTTWEKNVVVWESDIGTVVKGEVGETQWQSIADHVRREEEIDIADVNKNSMFIAYRLQEAKQRSIAIPSLEKLCNSIIEFAKT